MVQRLHIGGRASFSSVPNLVFTSGVAGSLDLAQFVSNPRNSTVTYSIVSGSLPPGCSLSGSVVSWTGTGTIASTPIQWRISQFSRTNDSLPAVVTIGGRATVSWTPPTQNTDNTTLTDLTSYRLYGSVNGGPTSLLSTITAPATSTTANGLAAGTWIFHITAVNSAGIESAASNTASTVIA